MGSDIDEEPTPTTLTSLTDDLLTFVASFLRPPDLLNMPAIDRRFRSLDLDAIWKRRCRSRWADWPRYRMSPARELHLDEAFPDESWKRRFLLIEEDAARTTLTREELEGLGWYFNFTPEAGGRGDETLARAFFRNGILYLDRVGYPPLPYRLVDVNAGQQQLSIIPFPSHNIHRIQEDKEWLICNENVTLVSCGEEGELRYNQRGFRHNITSIDARDFNWSLPR